VLVPEGRKPRLPGVKCPKAKTVSFDPPCEVAREEPFGVP
jgi:hypothetical protein